MAAEEGAKPGSSLRGGEGVKPPVEYARFAEVNTENKALKAKIAELEPKAAELDKLTPKFEELKTQHKSALGAMDEERALFKAGILDTEGHAIARTLYGALPAEGKPASLSEWVATVSAEPTKAPKGLAPYLPQPAAEAKPAAKVDPASTVNPTGTGKPPAAPGNLTPDAIRAAMEKARASGNMTELASLLGYRA